MLFFKVLKDFTFLYLLFSLKKFFLVIYSASEPLLSEEHTFESTATEIEHLLNKV